MKMFWKLYWNTPKKYRERFLREHFWGWMMYHMPRLYRLCDKYLPFDTLPF